MADFKISRIPFPIVSAEKAAFKETYGGAEDVVAASLGETYRQLRDTDVSAARVDFKQLSRLVGFGKAK